MMMCENCNVEFIKQKNPYSKWWWITMAVGWFLLIFQWAQVPVLFVVTVPLFLVAIILNILDILDMKYNWNSVYFCPECGRKYHTK